MEDYLAHSAKMMNYVSPGWIKAGLWSSASAIFLNAGLGAGRNRFSFPSVVKGLRRGVMLTALTSVIAEALTRVQKSAFPTPKTMIDNISNFSKERPWDTIIGTALGTIATWKLYKSYKNSKQKKEDAYVYK